MDQNAVEVDFVVDIGETVLVIEAKSGEAPDSRKLGFKKVVPVIEKCTGVQTAAIVACTVPEEGILPQGNYVIQNPLRTPIAQAFKQ